MNCHLDNQMAVLFLGRMTAPILTKWGFLLFYCNEAATFEQEDFCFPFELGKIGRFVYEKRKSQ